MSLVGRRRVLWLALVATSIVALLLPAADASAQTDPTPPTTVVPPLPEQLDPFLAGLSPVMWQACDAVGLGAGLIVLSGTLVGAPSDVVVPVNDAFGQVSGPVLSAFFETCLQIPFPDDPPDCETDEVVPPLPTLGRPIPPFGLIASELRAMETSLEAAGVPVNGALSRAADDILACADGTNPDEGTAADPDSSPDLTDDAPQPNDDGPFPPSNGTSAPPTPPSREPLPVDSSETGSGGSDRPLDASPNDNSDDRALQTVTIAGVVDDGATLAYLLLALMAASLLLWWGAGRHRGTADDDMVPA